MKSVWLSSGVGCGLGLAEIGRVLTRHRMKCSTFFIRLNAAREQLLAAGGTKSNDP